MSETFGETTVSNIYLEKIAQMFNHPSTTSGMPITTVPSKHVNTKKPVESVVKTVARNALEKAAAELGAVEKLHRFAGKGIGLFGGVGTILGDMGHTLSGKSVRDVVAENARIQNPYMTHKELSSLVSKSDDELLKHLTDTVPGNIHDINHPVYQLNREMNKRNAARVLGLTGVTSAAYAKYRHDREQQYLDAVTAGYNY